ncbi:MAG: hypothetical protein JWP57_3045 [Spirosoma sp.]|nr:hypothetical protein [Spirosoma sp.]
MTHAPINLTDPFTIAIAMVLLVLLLVQVGLILRNKTLTLGRKSLRAALNVFLWLALVGYILQISWPVNRPATHALLAGDDVPATYVRMLQDSLRIQERFTTGTFKPNPDSITLVGQDFPVELLTRLSQSTVRWIPYDQSGRIYNLRWKGVVRQGEMQHITGHIQSPDRRLLRVQFGHQTLDSLMLKPGSNPITLQFPAFGRGRIQTELVLGEEVIDTVRFYTRPTAPLQVRFVLDNPDFESKTLAEWLGKQGHSVQVLTTLAKNVQSTTGINRTSVEKGKNPHLVITDPTNANNPFVRRAIAEGKAVLFINLSNPLADVAAINRALGTRWQVMRYTNQESVPAGNGMTAHPYRFAHSLNQFAVAGYPVAMQQIAGRVGLSLLNETFSLALSGDTTAYSRIWYAVMAQLQPAEKNNVLVDAPVYSRLPNNVFVNNPVVNLPFLRVGTDTVRMVRSPLNLQSSAGALLTKLTGWQPVQDSLAIWVELIKKGNPAADRQVVSQFMRAHANYESIRTATSSQTRQESPNEVLPNWAWLTIFLICLTALWVEPKIA